MSFWTPERERQLIALWNAQSSAALIAWQFDTTVNAVIGKVDRLRKSGVAMRTTKSTKTLSPGQRASLSGGTAKRAPRPSTQSALAPSLPAPDEGGPRQTDPQTAHPPAQQTVQTVNHLPSGQPESSEKNAVVPQERSLENVAEPEGPFMGDPSPASVALTDARPDQCRFPIWPHMAMPDHPDYGQVCGAAVASDGASYCGHHKAMCETPRAKQSHGNRLAARQVRTARYREAHSDGVSG